MPAHTDPPVCPLVRVVEQIARDLHQLSLLTGVAEVSCTHFIGVLGYAPGELESHSRTWERLVHPDDATQARRRLSEHLEGRAAPYESEHRMRRQDGGWTWVLVRGKVVARDSSGRPARMVGLQADTTMRRAAERRIAHMALDDALTDLLNRTLFGERLNQLVVRAAGMAAASPCWRATSTGARP